MGASLKDVLHHLVMHSTGYPTAADRDEHLHAVAELADDKQARTDPAKSEAEQPGETGGSQF